MNKFGIVLGVAVTATLAGCVDPYYTKPADRTRNDVKVVEPATPAEEAPVDVTPVETTEEVVIVEETTPAEPTPAVEPEPQPEPVVEPTPVEPETTTYIVQRGDYLAKISKKYNIKIDAIRKLNPQLKGDVVKIGQKIQLPGKIDVGAQTVPEGAFAKPAPKEYKAYEGATTDYTVKGGDTLGKIAYGNGINIRQLKEMNGLTSNMIRVGQVLKIPATTAKAEPAPAPAAEQPAPAETAPVVEPTPAETAPTEPALAEAAPVVEPAPAEATPAPATDAVTHVVQEGDDILGLSIRYSLSPAEIRELNNLGETDELKPGQVLKLPADTQL